MFRAVTAANTALQNALTRRKNRRCLATSATNSTQNNGRPFASKSAHTFPERTPSQQQALSRKNHYSPGEDNKASHAPGPDSIERNDLANFSSAAGGSPLADPVHFTPFSEQPERRASRKHVQEDPMLNDLTSHVWSSLDKKSPPTRKPEEKQPTQNPLLKHIYQPHPKPINCTTFTPTRLFIEDESHPLHIRTTRRHAAFDPKKFYWRIYVPLDVSKRPAIRNWAEKRMNAAFMKGLKNRGLKKDGTWREGGEQGLSGALLMTMPKDSQRALRFSNEEAEESVKAVLNKVMMKHSSSLEHRQHRPRSEARRQPPRPGSDDSHRHPRPVFEITRKRM